MRDDETHPPAHLLIDAALLFAPKDNEQRKAGRRLLEDGGKVIYHAMRSGPLPVDTRLHELGIRNAIFNAEDLPDIKQKPAGRNRIGLRILVKGVRDRSV